MLDKKFFEELASKYPSPTTELLFDISDSPVGQFCFVSDTIGIEPNMCYEDEIYPVYEEHLQNIQKHIWEILIGNHVVNPYIYEVKEENITAFIADHSNKMNLVVANRCTVPNNFDALYCETFPKDYFLIVPVHGFSLHSEGTKFYQQEKYERKMLEVKMEYSFSIAQNKPYYAVKVVK